MFIAMNRFKIVIGQEEIFENVWRNRESYLDTVPGFVDFKLLRGEPGEDTTVFLSHSTWESEQAFIDWTKSEAFRMAHKQARTPEGVLMGHPQFEGYNSVDLTRKG